MKSRKATPQSFPNGVTLESLHTNIDHRGSLTEIFRQSWATSIAPVQWNAVATNPGVLRGVHVHVVHFDYMIVLTGRASVGLRDLRSGSPTEGMATIVELCGEELSALTIPPGVAHGFYIHDPSLHVYAVSDYWDPADELGCCWSDPALEIQWPTTSPILSERDAAAGPLSALLGLIPPFTA